MFRVFFVLKTNPTWQQMKVETQSRDRRAIRRSIVSHTRILANRVRHDVEALWSARRELFGQAPNYAVRIFGDLTFLVDTFPIVVLRSKQRPWRRGTFSGKYKEHVLKAQVSCLLLFSSLLLPQMLCNFAGVPLCVTGPHAGVRSDIDIFRGHKPELDATELGLGDKGNHTPQHTTQTRTRTHTHAVTFARKAYYGDADVEPPFKKRPHAELNEEQEAYNTVHRFVVARSSFSMLFACAQLAACHSRTLNRTNEKVRYHRRFATVCCLLLA
jgi:hypothetical protein